MMQSSSEPRVETPDEKAEKPVWHAPAILRLPMSETLVSAASPTDGATGHN